MTRNIAWAGLVGLLLAPAAMADGPPGSASPMAGETALSSERLQDVRGLGNHEELPLDKVDVRATGEAGTNAIGDSFANFSGVGHVIQNNGNGAAIGVTTQIDVGPQVDVAP